MAQGPLRPVLADRAGRPQRTAGGSRPGAVEPGHAGDAEDVQVGHRRAARRGRQRLTYVHERGSPGTGSRARLGDTMDRRGYAAAMPGSNRTPPTRDQVRFCRSVDGARIAYATHGDGPPLLVNTCWLSHLQHDWESPVWQHFLLGLGEIATVTRYDERGFGLSDRDVPDFTFESRVADLEAVVEASGLDRFALLGMAQGGPVAVAYAHRHPHRLTRLILASTFAALVRRDEDEALHDTFSQMIRVGWARPDALFRRVFTNMMIPGATEEQMRWIDELQRTSTTAEVLLAARPERMKVDVTDLLGELRVPTLVIHAVG